MEEAVLGLGARGAAEGDGLVGAQDEVAEIVFLLGEGCGFLLRGLTAADVEIGLSFVAAEVENFEGAKVLVGGLFLTLNADETFASGMDCKLAEIGGNPLAAQLFGNGSGCAGADRRNRQSDHLRCYSCG